MSKIQKYGCMSENSEKFNTGKIMEQTLILIKFTDQNIFLQQVTIFYNIIPRTVSIWYLLSMILLKKFS